MKILRVLIAFILLMLIADSAWAVTKYLAQSATGCEAGSNTDYNAGTNTCGSGSSTIFIGSTYETAWDTLGASNTLIAKAGTYTGACSLGTIEGGTSSAPTTISNAPGEAVTFLRNSGTSGCVVRIDNNWIQFVGDNKANLILDSNRTTATTRPYVIYLVNSNFKLSRVTVQNSPDTNSCIFSSSTVNNVTIEHSEIKTCGDPDDALGHGLYLQGLNTIVRNSVIHDTSNFGIQAYSSAAGEASNPLIEGNLVYDWHQATSHASQATASGIIVDGDNAIVRNNNIVCPNLADTQIGINAAFNNSTQTGVKIYNNSIHGCNIGISLNSVVSGAEIKNNIINSSTDNIANSGTGTAFATNGCDDADTGCTIVTVGFKDSSNNDLSLLSTSTAINAGTSGLAGITCNGSCDMGAHQTLNSPAPSCRVDDAAPNTIKVLFTINAKPPLQVANVTGITTTVAAGGRTPSAPSVQAGGTEIWYTISGAAVTVGQAVTWAAGSTNTITNSALIGGTQNQGLHSTGTITCSNLVDGGAPSYVFTITRTQFFEFYSPLNSLLGVRGVENGDATISQNGKTRLRYKIACTGAACPSIGALVRYSKNGGAYTALSASFANGIRMPGDISHPDTPVCGATTTEILTSGHATDDNGLYACDPNAVPTVELVQNSEMENEVALEFDTTIVPGDQFCFKVTDHTGDELTNPDPPCLVVVSPGLIGRF